MAKAEYQRAKERALSKNNLTKNNILANFFGLSKRTRILSAISRTVGISRLNTETITTTATDFGMASGLQGFHACCTYGSN